MQPGSYRTQLKTTKAGFLGMWLINHSFQGRSAGQASSAGRRSATNIKNDITGTKDLMSREEEYKYDVELFYEKTCLLSFVPGPTQTRL